MIDLKESLLKDIKAGLLSAWKNSKTASINAELSTMNATDAKAGAAIAAKSRALTNAVEKEFETYWQNLSQDLLQQYDIFYGLAEYHVLERHPWLVTEQPSAQDSLKTIFLRQTLEHLLFELLENKLPRAKDWKSFLITPEMRFVWAPLNPLSLANKIAGYPLSNTKFYDNRPLPSFLDAPLALSPMRYDLYRLLKKNYDKSFKEKTLKNGVISTAMAPLHHSELPHLTQEEWDNFETIMINIGEETQPEWVLLDKKKGAWTLYAPGFLEAKCQSIPILQTFQFHEVRHLSHTVYDELIDWHAVLLSRVLPWCKQSKESVLENFRPTIPISLLLQNAIEASCLPAQKKSELASQKAFAKAKPLSLLEVGDLYAAELQSVPPETPFLFPNIPDKTSAASLIKAMEDGAFSYYPTENAVSIADPDKFIEAMKFAFHQHAKSLALLIAVQDAWKPWFQYNLDITRVDAAPGAQYSYAHACAARNRFLARTDFFARHPNNIEASKIAWEQTGTYIYHLFKTNPNPNKAQLTSIAEMGKEGLDVFFAFINTIQKPALSCTLDLNSGLTLDSSEYIRYLSDKIHACKKRPLFTKLDLILPQPLTEASQAALIALLTELNARGEITEVSFQNPHDVSLDFITQLKDLATTNPTPFLLQIKIPEWDETVAPPHKGSLKAEYRELQNLILGNIRLDRDAQLSANTFSIHRPLPVRHLKRGAQVVDDRSWRAGVVYSLSSGGVGVQQQAQQEVAQEVQQEAEQQTQPDSAEREIGLFKGNPDQLITRHNITAHDGSVEDYSLWVGSEVDAAFVIQGMDAAGYHKIRAYPSLFKFGLDPWHTPGFRLQHLSADAKELILTFDPDLEEKDRLAQKLEPFAIQMTYRKHPTPFDGDYRQLNTLALQGPEPEFSVWHFVANETLSHAIQTWLSGQGCDPNTSESMQYLDLHKRMKKAENRDAIIAMMKDWARAKLQVMGRTGLINDEAFLAALFDDMTPENLQAFGQLFYHYDAKGCDHFLNLAHQLYQKFPNPDHFALYKQKILLPLADWSESLQKEEVEALTSSMQKLEGHKAYQNMFWGLIAAHGHTVIQRHDDDVIPMHFSEVWQAFNRVIDYIDTNSLVIEESEFLNVLQNYPGQFNASQFLRRLYEVLQQTGNKADSNHVQQDILNHLSEIDWRENGFYYACVHENYPYWDPALKLSGLRRLDTAEMPTTYEVIWDEANLHITDAVGFTLRYAAQRLKLAKPKFDTFKSILIGIEQQNTHKNAALFRLMTTSLALGLDTVDSIHAMDPDTLVSLSHDRYHAILDSMNQQMRLDSKDLASQSYHVKMTDLPILVEVLSEFGLDTLPPLDLTVINALGRALQAFSGDKKTQLQRLIQFGLQHGFDHPLVSAYPWLVNDHPDSHYSANPEQIKFYQQLRSIHFPSAILPDKDSLMATIEGIETEEDRHHAVSALIGKKCYITDQDAAFRLLKPVEKQLLDGLFLSKTFGRQNRLLLTKLFDNLAIKDKGDTQANIKKLLDVFTNLDRKNYYDELGQLLGLLVEKARNNQYYSVEQLTTWISTVFNQNTFKTKPYPVPFITALLNNALRDGDSSLINQNLHQLAIDDHRLESLQDIMARMNVAPLSDRAKQTLVKFAIEFKYHPQLSDFFPHFEALFNQSSAAVVAAMSDVINGELLREPALLLQNLPMLEKLALPCMTQDDQLKKLWEANQIKLLEGITKKTLDTEQVALLVNVNNEYVRSILTAAVDAKDNEMLIKMVNTQLINLKPASDLQKLARYYLTDPKPSLTHLNSLLTLKRPLSELINYYERVVQAGNKRVYSVEAKEAVELKRVLEGFKLKGKRNLSASEQAGLLNTLYYINTYSQVLKLSERSPEELLDLIQDNKVLDTEEGKARVLACMREMMLRKTGKWANHTQMLDLIYGVMHNDDNLIHQIRTGEGKSIITLMRVAYRALNGQVVDVFSSKDSLSSRDHEEFSPVFDAFGIPHSHITDKSPPEAYRNGVNENGIGAVHYATMGNFSLFLAGLSWDDKAQLDTRAENRVAFLDEADHILRFENTQFNYSDQEDASSVYNYDAWVYQITYEFYLRNRGQLEANNFEVSETPHLQDLYEELQAASLSIAPDKSAFFQKYLASGDETLRNQKLLKLLSAAHTAQGLENGVEFCVMEDQKKLSDTVTLDTRFARVMINNQVSLGSTYSDLVQQFLHTRLNYEAILQGERPNFFIEPESEIALALNARFVLKNYYRQIEGCTGTPGNEKALAFYKNEFGIDTVIKLPTHEKVKTVFLPPIYAPNEDTQIEQIVASILANPEQPILIACEDDKSVERLGNLIKLALDGQRDVLIDTNAQGLSESEVVKDAGKPGAITISSRMGRGTNIEPSDRELGLKVIRTYAAAPEIEKQEKGRQGRNAAGGVCVDIINYAPIKAEAEKYLLANEERFQVMLAYETEHLELKLNKHRGDNNAKWAAIKQDPEMKQSYLYTRTLLRLKHQILEESKQRMYARDALIAEGSDQVMAHLFRLPLAEKERFKKDWKACKEVIETGWPTDLDGSRSRDILDTFYKSNKMPPPQRPRIFAGESPVRLHGNEAVAIDALIHFHQMWVRTRADVEQQLGIHQNPELVAILYGENGAHLEQLYQAFSLLNTEQIATLTDLVAHYPNCHSIAGGAWVAAIDMLANDADIAETYAARVEEFFKKNARVPKNAEDIKAYSKLFLAAVAGAPDVDFIKDIILDVMPENRRDALLAKVDHWPRGLVDLCKNCMSQEDVVFLLNKIIMHPDYEEGCLNYLSHHHKALKEAPYMIRPLIGLQFQKNPEHAPISPLDYSQKTGQLLDFFNQRPSFTSKDFRDMQAKVDRIAPENQPHFLRLLATIPPNMPASTVLSDLSDLPGKYGFDNGAVYLHQRFERIQMAATAFNNFMFDHGLIASKEVPNPVNEEEYRIWCGFVGKISLDKREQFFTGVKPLSHIDLGPLKRLAASYAGDEISTEGLQTEINTLALPQPKKGNQSASTESSSIMRNSMFGGGGGN